MLLLLAAVVVAAAQPASTTRWRAVASRERLLERAADSLLARHVTAAGGGWAWRSAIQAPHYFTDRDVGAAGIAMGLLSAYHTTHRQEYLEGARRAGDWLLAVAQRTRAGGLRWPDWHDRRGVSDTHFTSFDDGAAGISDLLWRLGSATGDRRYKRGALAGMRWLSSEAKGLRGARCPRLCRWRYYDDAPDYRTGMGEGNAGIVHAFATFAQRTGKRWLERYALGGARYLESRISPRGAIPERVGGTEYDTGFLSGSAGDAFMFLSLYRQTHSPRWLADAERLLTWVRSVGRPQRDGIAWPIEIDPREGGDRDLATGIEEGAAGIGWVELQAYQVTRDPVDLRTAAGAGDWLFGNTRDELGGNAWPEDLGRPIVHTSLDNGAPGIAWFLHDLALVTHDRDYEQAAHDARRWLRGVARTDSRGVFWPENGDGRRWRLTREPSWHWGTAGIVGFLARLRGWPIDMPGEEEGFGSR